MTGIDEAGTSRLQIDAQELAGDQGAMQAVVEQGLMGLMGLVGQVGSFAPRAAQSANKQGGDEGGMDVVAHGVGDGHVQGVAVEGVIEGVAGDLFGRDQLAGDRELWCFTGEAVGKEGVLDLSGQVHGEGAAAPLVQVGEAAVGDEDVSQGMGRFDDRLHSCRFGGLWEEDFKKPDGIPRLVTGATTWTCPSGCPPRRTDTRWSRSTCP